MKKLVSLFLLTALCGGCIDRDYDMDRFNGDVTIGNVWPLPLATIVVSMEELKDDTSNIQSIFDEVDVWTPTTLPDNADYVDIVRLADQTDPYIDEMVTALFEEMDAPSSPKLDQVAHLLYDRYLVEFTGFPDDEQGFVEMFEANFVGNDDFATTLRDQTGRIARDFLKRIKIEPIHYTADLNMDDDTVDLFTKGLDTDGEEGVLNQVYLYGTISSQFPIGFSASALFANTGVSIPSFEIHPDEEIALPEVRLFEEGIRGIIDDFDLDVNFSPSRYYPERGIDPSQTITLELNLRKTGGFNF